jgi:hypothetical protein
MSKMPKFEQAVILTSAMTFLIVVALVAAPFQTASAQATPPAASSTSDKGGGPRKHLATIIFAGLGGAVLGLSTLSFYGRPQDNLSNIAVGFAFGVITGTALVTYKAASSPEEFYGQGSLFEPSREDIQQQHGRPPLQLTYNFEF